MNLVQPRTDIGLVMLIGGAVLAGTFGWTYGIAMAAIGLVVVAHTILHGGSPGKLMISALVSMSLVSLWFIAAHNSGSGDPPGLDSVTGFAEEYRAALADTDLDAYLDISQAQLGDTLEEAFAVEAQCLEWHLARIVVAPHETPFFAVVTFSVEDVNLVRLFGYQTQTDRWTVTVETSC